MNDTFEVRFTLLFISYEQIKFLLNPNDIYSGGDSKFKTFTQCTDGLSNWFEAQPSFQRKTGQVFLLSHLTVENFCTLHSTTATFQLLPAFNPGTVGFELPGSNL